MKQPVKKNLATKTNNSTTKKTNNSTASKGKFKGRKKPLNKKYGTSKLEADFAKNFLDKYGIKYIYQYHAKAIDRYFDFAVVSKNNGKLEMEVKDGIECVKQEGQSVLIEFLIEVDGSYYHGDSRIVTEDKLSPMQKHNKFVDRLKDDYAHMRCIPILRIWELDIRNNQKMVIDELSKYVKLGESNTNKKTKILKKFKKD